MPLKTRSKIKFEQISLKELQQRIQIHETLIQPKRSLRSTEKRGPYFVHPTTLQK
jgi:hypothetical protein